MSESPRSSQASVSESTAPQPSGILRRQEAADDDASPSLASIRSEATTPRQGPRRPTANNIPKPQPLFPPAPSSLKHLPFPTPKQPSKCPLFCCFYTEFDNKVLSVASQLYELDTRRNRSSRATNQDPRCIRHFKHGQSTSKDFCSAAPTSRFSQQHGIVTTVLDFHHNNGRPHRSRRLSFYF
jgi:hypothetical protein